MTWRTWAAFMVCWSAMLAIIHAARGDAGWIVLDLTFLVLWTCALREELRKHRERKASAR